MISNTPKTTSITAGTGNRDKTAAMIAPKSIPTICVQQASKDSLNVFSIAAIAPKKANTILDVAAEVPNFDTIISDISTAKADLKVLRPMCNLL